MRRCIELVVLLVCVPPGWAAAPPGQTRDLTAAEQKEVAALDARAGKHALDGDFEQVAKVRQQIADYRRERQGARHWQATNERFALEEWKRLAAVAAKDRAEVMRAMMLSNEGLALLQKGRSREAEKTLHQARLTFEKVLGPDHPLTAASYNVAASCLNAQGKAAEALPLYRKALSIREKALGRDHPHTAASYNNVASCLHAQGKTAEALPLFKKALLIDEKVRGLDHPHTATCYNNVAFCLQAQGKAAEALPLLRKALSIREKVLGLDHPDVASSYNNVAVCLQDQGKAAEALPLHKKAIQIREKVLGLDHPDVALSYNNVASCLQDQGKAAEALALHKKAMLIQEKVLGLDHPDTALSYNNVATCLQDQGKAAEALPLIREAMRIWEKVFGLDHPRTAHGHNNVASCLWAQARREEAVLLWQQSVRGQEAARATRANSGFERAEGGTRRISVQAALAVALAGAKQPRNAFAHAEASLARGLLDDLAGLTPDQRERAADLRAQMAKLEPILASISSREKLSDEQTARQASARREYGRLWREWSDLHSAASEAAVLPLERIQRSIPDDGALVLWVTELGERWGCVVRRQGAPIWQRFDKPTDAEQAMQLYACLTDPSSGAKEREKLLAAFRTNWLDPLRPHLKGVKRLFVVPTGALARIPAELVVADVATSYVPSGSMLARVVENRRALDGQSLLALGDPAFDVPLLAEPPASGVLLTSVTAGGNAAKAGLRAGDVLLSVGDVAIESAEDVSAALKPVPADATFWRDGQKLKGRVQALPLGATFDKRSSRAAVRAWRKAQEATASRGTGHKRLPGTRVEAETISALVKNSTLLLGSDANEQKLDALLKSGAMKKHRLLHFATHGDVVESSPGRSALILAQDKLPDALEQAKAGAHVYDGRLTVSRIRTEWKGKIDADLVVLSACETGLGKDAKGDGLLGFAQAFLSAGARSVVLSRWPVDDVATSLLMRRFYQNLLGKRDGLKKPLGRAASLQEAKEWLRSLSAKDATTALESLPRGKLVSAPKGEGKAYEHPYYWAAFTLIGDPD